METRLHTIYYAYGHPEKPNKVGCTTDINRRMKQNGHPKYSILEELICTVEEAEDREDAWKFVYGMTVGQERYSNQINRNKKSQLPESVAKSTSYRIEKYGSVTAAMMTPKAREKAIDTTIKNHGSIAGQMHTPEARLKSIESHKKPVNQLDKKTGEIIKRWASQSDAARALNLHQANIGDCLNNGRQKTCGGYGWEYASE